MRRRDQIALAVSIITLVSVFAWQLLRDREPTYLGKPYSFWLKSHSESFHSGDFEQRNQAAAAIRKIGTNGIPILLQMISTTDSPWKEKANCLLSHQSLISFRFSRPFARSDRGNAFSGLMLLGKDAAPAVPALIQLLSDRDFGIRWDSVEALAVISVESDEALPPLIKCITGTDSDLRWLAAEFVGNRHRRPDLAVPALVDNLQSPHPDFEAMDALAKFGNAARSAEPVLTTFLNHPHRAFRQSATNALKKIDPQRAAELGVK